MAVNKKITIGSVQQDNARLRARLEQVTREKDYYQSKLPPTPVAPLFVDKLFNELNAYAKSRLIDYCRREIKEVFARMPSNKRTVSKGEWEAAVSDLIDAAEQFILLDSGRAWKLRGKGSAGFKSYDASNMTARDHITLTFAHPARKKPALGKNLAESPTPEPVDALLSVRILKAEVFGG